MTSTLVCACGGRCQYVFAHQAWQQLGHMDIWHLRICRCAPAWQTAATFGLKPHGELPAWAHQRQAVHGNASLCTSTQSSVAHWSLVQVPKRSPSRGAM